MLKFKHFVTEAIGPAAVKAREMGLRWGGYGQWANKKGQVTHKQAGTNILEPVKQPYNLKTAIAKEKKLSAHEVRSKIDKGKWNELGKGMSSAAYDGGDKDSVVKVSGAGMQGGDQAVDKAWTHFLIDHGKTNKHYPNVLDVNAEHPSVYQMKVEKLKPIADHLGDHLSDLADAHDSLHTTKHESMKKYHAANIVKIKGRLHAAMSDDERKVNNVDHIEDAIKTVIHKKNEYTSKYTKHKVFIDLHPGNFMQRGNHEVVVNDPWFGDNRGSGTAPSPKKPQKSPSLPTVSNWSATQSWPSKNKNPSIKT